MLDATVLLLQPFQKLTLENKKNFRKILKLFLYWKPIWISSFVKISHTFLTAGVKPLGCRCNAEKKIMIRTIERQQNSITGTWASLDAMKQCLKYHGQFSWLHQKALCRETRYKNRKFSSHMKLKDWNLSIVNLI